MVFTWSSAVPCVLLYKPNVFFPSVIFSLHFASMAYITPPPPLRPFPEISDLPVQVIIFIFIICRHRIRGKAELWNDICSSINALCFRFVKNSLNIMLQRFEAFSVAVFFSLNLLYFSCFHMINQPCFAILNCVFQNECFIIHHSCFSSFFHTFFS